MIYNFNLGICWASSGVEYAQAYRAKILRNIGQKHKFVFTDMFPRENIEHLTKNIGFWDSEIIWLYTFFTDCRIAPVSYTLKELEQTFGGRDFVFSREGKEARYTFSGNGNFYRVHMVDDKNDWVHRVEFVSENRVIRKDYYTYCRIYSEYYAPLDKQAHLYHRRFFNEDGTVAYEEINDDGTVMYKFPDKLICSKEELVGYMVSRLHLTKDDVVIIDRNKENGQAIMQNAGGARIGVVIHAEHFNEGATDDTNILWNNYYEYAFSQYKKIDFYIVATDEQNRLLREHFLKYKGITPNVVTIPVGSLTELKKPGKERRKHSLITASRLEAEKHVDWLIDAVAAARESVSDVTLDIYGKGTKEKELRDKIAENHAEEYIRLCGQHDLTDVYQEYEAYLSASTSEGFGLTLMEAIGSGLPIIGFDVRYGNQNFIEDGKNGYLIPVTERTGVKERVSGLSDRIVKLFEESDLSAFHAASYEKAETYLTAEVEKRWVELLKNQK